MEEGNFIKFGNPKAIVTNQNKSIKTTSVDFGLLWSVRKRETRWVHLVMRGDHSESQLY